jgi:hypothetical protein
MANLVVDVTQVLLGAQSPDETTRSAAEAQVRQLQQQNYPSFVASMAAELSNPAKPPDARRLAGIVLKNSLHAKDEAARSALHAAWASLEPGLRQGVRDALLQTLSTDAAEVRHTAAVTLAKVLVGLRLGAYWMHKKYSDVFLCAVWLAACTLWVSAQSVGLSIMYHCSILTNLHHAMFPHG